MKVFTALVLVCLALVPLACGGSESATGAGTGEATSGDPAVLPKIGSYPQEGPFAAISGRKGNKKPHIDPPERPPPKNPVVRDLEKGSGPPAQIGDEITIYYAGAVYETGEVQYYGWPPAPPTTFELGAGLIPRLYELAFVGVREGGIREVIAPSRFFNGTGAVDYVMVLVNLNPA